MKGIIIIIIIMKGIISEQKSFQLTGSYLPDRLNIGQIREKISDNNLFQ